MEFVYSVSYSLTNQKTRRTKFYKDFNAAVDEREALLDIPSVYCDVSDVEAHSLTDTIG